MIEDHFEEIAKNTSMSNTVYYHLAKEVESCCFPQFQTLDHQSCNNNSNHEINFPIHASRKKYRTLESSSPTGGYTLSNSASTVSFSSNGSSISQESQFHSPDTIYGSPMSGSCITDDVNDLRHKLRELESAMLGPDLDIVPESHIETLHEGIALPDMVQMPRNDLKSVLIASAKAVSENDYQTAQRLMSQLREMVSVSGEPIQRLGAYMYEGLVARLASSGSFICKEPKSSDLLSYMHILHEVCPYLKFGYMSANGAIAEALKKENRVHIVDFQIGQGSQWVTLIQAFAARPGGPPHIRITAIDDSTSVYGERTIVGKRLSRLAESFKVPFEFNAIQAENLRVQPGEALAVNFAFALHHMPDESVSTQNARDRLLRLVKSLSPKVVTLVEQESNTNTAPFFPRFLEALDYYSAMFESIDVMLPRGHKERINVEQHCLARDVVNVLACEGGERVERHELLGKWKSRFKMAGFSPYPLSSLVNGTIKKLLENYSEKYRLEESDGALYLGWRSRDLVGSCAWQ